MPKYDLISNATGRTYRVEAERPLSDDEAANTVAHFDNQAQEAEQTKPFLDVTDLASSVGSAFGSLTKTLPASLQRMRVGLSRPDTYPESAKQSFAAEKTLSDRLNRENTYRLLTGNLGSAGETIREAAPSLGFSVASMGSAIPATVAGGVAGTAIGGPVGGVIGGTAAGMAASGAAAYRMAGSQFLDDAYNTYVRNHHGISEEEKNSAYQELLPLAQESALWEAGPEAIGNAATMGAGRVILGLGKETVKRLAKKALAKVGAGVGAQATELATETATQLGQGLPQAQADAFNRGEDMSQAQSPYAGRDGVTQAFKDVAPQTLALGGLMLGATGAAAGIKRSFTGKPATPEEAIAQTVEGTVPAPIQEEERLAPEVESAVERYLNPTRPTATTTRIEAKPAVMGGRGSADVRMSPVRNLTQEPGESNDTFIGRLNEQTKEMADSLETATAETVMTNVDVLPATAAAIAEDQARVAREMLKAAREAHMTPPAPVEPTLPTATTTRIEAKPAVMNGRGAADVRVAPVQKEIPSSEPTPTTEEITPPVEPIPAVEEAPTPPTTENKFPQTENVVAPSGEPGVGLGMDKLNTASDTLFQLPPAQKRNLSTMREKVIAKMDEIEALPYDSKLTDARDKAFTALEKLLLDIDTERLSQSKGNAPKVRKPYVGPTWSEGRPTVAEAEAYLTEQVGPELQSGVKGSDPDGWWGSIEGEVRAGTPRNRAIVEAAMDHQKITAEEAAKVKEETTQQAQAAVEKPVTVEKPAPKQPDVEPEVVKSVGEKFVNYTPQKLPKVKKPQPEEALKNLYPIVAGLKDGRPVLSGVHIAEENGGKVAVATNGKRLVVIPYSGSKPAGKVYATGKDKLNAEGKELDLQYPNWKVVIPEVGPLSVPISEDALSKIEQAAKENKSKKGTLVDRVFVHVSLTNGDMVLVDPEYLYDVVKALRASGETDFRLNITDKMSSLTVTTANPQAKGVLMPARANDYQKYLSLGRASTQQEAPPPQAQPVAEKEAVGTPEKAKPSKAKLTPEEQAALRLSKRKGAENRGDGIFFIPEKLVTPEVRNAVKRGGNNVEFKAWADVTGNPSDRGYAVLDRQARQAERETLPPVDQTQGEGSPSQLPTTAEGSIPAATVQKNTEETEKSSAAEGTPQEGKYSVYQAGNRWLIQQSNKRGFGDQIVDSQDEAIKESLRQQDMERQNKAFFDKQKAKEDSAKAEQEAKDKPLNDYLDDLGLTAMQRGKLKKTLQEGTARRSSEKNKDYTGPREKVIREMVEDGYSPKTEEVSAIKELTGRQSNRMDNREQAEFERKRKAAGNKTEYSLETESGARFIITKAEHDYAKWLSAQTTPTPTNANEVEKANRTPAVEGKPAEQEPSSQTAEGTAQREGAGAEVTTQRDTSKPEQMTPAERGQLGHQEVIEIAKQDYDLAKTGRTWGYSGGQNYKSKAAAVKDTKARLDKVSAPTESDIKRGASDHYGEVNKALADQKPVSKAAVDAYGITLPEGYVADGELYVYRPEGGAVEVSPAPTKPKVSKNTFITDAKRDEALKGLKETTRLGGQTNMLLDPTMFKHAVVLGAYYVERGARTFAQFSKAMIDDIGEYIRENLQDIYNEVRKQYGQRAGFEGMDEVAPVDNKKATETTPDNKNPTPVTKTEEKAAPAPETKASEPHPPAKPVAPTTQPSPLEGPVSIVNEQLNQVAEIIGLPRIETPLDGPYKWEKAWEDARVEMERNPNRGSELVSEMLSRPREVSPVEVPILLREAVIRTNAYNAAVDAQTKASASEQESANQRVSDAVNALADVQQASAVMGTFSGRALNFRKMSAWMDFSLANMVVRLQGAKQADLTPEEMKAAQDTHKTIAKIEEEIAKTKASAGAEAELTSVFDETFKEALALTKKTANDLIAQSRVAAKQGKTMKDFLVEKREEARKRIRQRGGNLNMGLNPADLFDHAVIMASYIAEGVVSLADLTSKMIGDFGPGVEKHIPQIKKEVDALLEAEQSVFEKPEEGTPKSYAEQLVESQGESLSDRWVYNRVKEWLVEQGEAGLKRDSKELLNEVFEIITQEVNAFDKSITEQQLRDMFSGYGKVKFPDPEATAKKLRQMRRLELLFDKLERARAGVAPLRAGLQRDETTSEERDALKLLNQTMKDLDIPRAPSGANIKTPLDAVKSRLKNSIEDLEKQIEKRKRTERPRKDVEYDADATVLEAKREALQKQLDEIDPPRPPTAQERIAARLKDLNKQITELERRIKEKDFTTNQNETPITEKLQVKMDERDALTQTLKELRIAEEGLPVRTQEQVNKDAQASLTRQINTLEEQIRKQDFAPKEGLKPEASPQLFRLKARVEALRKQRDQLKEDLGFRKKQKTDDELIDAAVASLEKSIDGLNKQINDGDLASKTRTSKTPEVAKIKNLRAERDSLREEVQRLRKAKEDAAKDPVAEKIKADRKQLQRMIEGYEKRIAEGNFRKRPKIAKHYDDSLMQLEIDLDNIKAEWSKKVFEARLASRPKLKQIFDAGGQVLNTSRAILTSMDLSAVLRQGGFIALGNPIRAARNIMPMLRAFTSDDVSKASLKRLKQRDNWRNYVTAGLFISETDQTKMSAQEEAFMSRWIDKIPGGAKGFFIGSLVRGSQRAYTTFLNNLRADTFDSLLNQLQKGPTPTREEMESIARYINVATGRGDLGKGAFNQAAVGLNTVFFAPRLVVSRFQMIGGMPIFKATGRTKALVLQEYAKFLMGAALVYALAGMAQDDDDEPLELDPRSSDFLKIRFGDTRVDPLGGLIQSTVFVSRIVSGEKKASSGKIVPIRDTFRLPNLFRENPMTNKVPYGGSNAADVTFTFLRTKFSPATGAVFDLTTGENVIGEKVTPGDVAYKMVVPMSYDDAKDAIEAHGLPKGVALTTVMLFGAGVMTYNNQKK